MAERRMFAKTIVTSDAFLDLPPDARCLYFSLAMFADDDGFVNGPKSVARQTGAKQEDLDILIEKRFLLAFDNGVVVIKHWRIHNYIQKDRYKESKYLKEKASLMIDENGAYTERTPCVSETDTLCIQNGYNLYPKRIQSVSKMDTQVSIGKDSIEIGKDSVCINISREDRENTPHTHTPTFEEVEEYCKKKGYSFASRFFSYYESINWLDKNGKQIDWRSKADYWKACDDERQGKPRFNESFDADEAFEIAKKRAFE